MSNKEKQDGVEPFLCKNWEARREGIAGRIKRKQDASHARAVLRKENATNKPPTKKEIKAAKIVLKKVEAKKARHNKFKNKLKKQNV